MSQQQKSSLTMIALAGVPFMMVLGNSMLIPVLPQMKQALDISQFKVSLVITLFSIPAGLTIPILGYLSDRYRRKPIILLSLLVYATGGVIAGLAAAFMDKNAYAVIMAGRIMQGIGAAGTAPLAMALAGDLYQSGARSKSLGVLEAANGLGKVVSPILGSLVGLLAWWTVLFVFPVLCIPIILALWLGVKEPAPQESAEPFRQYLSSLRQIFQQKGLFLTALFLAGGIVLFTLFGLLFYLSDYLETKYGLDGVIKGLIIAIPVLAMASTSYLTGVFMAGRRSFAKPLIIGGLGLLAASTGLLGLLARQIYVLIGALVVGGIGTGIVLTNLNTLITSSCETEERGMITSLYGSIRFFGVAAGPPLFGLLMEKSPFWTFMLPTLLVVFAGVVNLFTIKNARQKKN
ncbi:MAG: MFS transporter [Peptococcia bacterium]